MRARLRRGGRYFTRLWRVFDLWGGGRFLALGFSDALCSAPDGRAYFLLLRQKKVAKEKATPRHRSFGMKLQRSSLRCSTCRAAAELALRAQTVLADCPRPVSAARRRRGDQRQYRVEMRAAAVSVSFGFDLSCPVRRRATEGGAEKGEDCLSRRRVPQPPSQPSSAGHPEGAPNRARLLFGYFFLARQEKVSPPVRGGTQRLRQAKENQPQRKRAAKAARQCAAKPIKSQSTNFFPVSNSQASTYLSRVRAMTSAGNAGPGACLFQSNVSR